MKDHPGSGPIFSDEGSILPNDSMTYFQREEWNSVLDKYGKLKEEFLSEGRPFLDQTLQSIPLIKPYHFFLNPPKADLSFLPKQEQRHLKEIKKKNLEFR